MTSSYATKHTYKSAMEYFDVRRHYKETLARKRNEERESEDRKESFNMVDCLRCKFARDGMIFIPGHLLCTCVIQMPEADKVIELHEAEDYALSDVKQMEFTEEDFKMSIVLGHTDSTPAIGADSLPHKRTEDMDEGDPKAARIRHKCNAISVRFSKECLEIAADGGRQRKSPKIERKSLTLKGACHDGTSPTHVVIYASSGLGKTYMKAKLSERGIFILDTDDVPFMNADRMRSYLRWTSVVTNRLDLIREDMASIVFIPKSIETQRNRLRYRVSEEELSTLYYRTWGIRTKRMYRMYYEQSFVSDWFDFSPVTHEQTLPGSKW